MLHNYALFYFFSNVSILIHSERSVVGISQVLLEMRQRLWKSVQWHKYSWTNSDYTLLVISIPLRFAYVIPTIGASKAVGILRKNYARFRENQLSDSNFIEKSPYMRFLAVFVSSGF